MWMRRCIWIGVAVGLTACRLGTPLQFSSLPVSLAGRKFDQPDSVNLADYLCRWHPHDWRAHLARALDADDSTAQRRSELMAAVRIRPREPLLLYALALNLLAAHTAADDSAAVDFLTVALAVDPDNGVLDLTRSVAQIRLGRVFVARTVFQTTRGFPGADLYGRRLEDALLGMLDKGLRLNPYDLIQAGEWYRKMPLPPVEEWSDALETIFLDPLRQHPYDIRWRGREAALGLYRLGQNLVAVSLNPDRIFSDGREERLLGWLLQAKAAEFLVDYEQTFDRPISGFDGPEAVQWRLQNGLSESSAIPADWEHYLADWEQLGQSHPTQTLAWAVGKMRGENVWQKVLRHRLVFGDAGD